MNTIGNFNKPILNLKICYFPNQQNTTYWLVWERNKYTKKYHSFVVLNTLQDLYKRNAQPNQVQKLVKYLADDTPCHDRNGLSDLTERKPTMQEYIFLSNVFKRINVKYNKKLDSFNGINWKS